VTGPTASGKTAVGIALAERLGAEIISLDSMALYRGMDIGTAKPTRDQRQRIAHHLVDIVEPNQEYSLAQYVADAGRTVAEIAARGRVALFAGGTPLYLKALLRGIFSGPPADWPLRKTLQAEAEQAGAAALHARLAQVDPLSARRLHPRDARRVIRALEVFEKTGRSISELQQQFERARPAAACRVFALDWPVLELNRRIDARVDVMFARGLIAEVKGLLAGAHPPGRTAGQALGYREVIEHFASGSSVAETIDRVKLHTRQFAKRQRTWFRSLSECRPVAIEDRLDAERIAAQIVAAGEPGD
jgi:tRNA dimethylallyltransferase